MIYTYQATLRNGTIVRGEYQSNNLESNKIKVSEATEDNPVVSISIQEKKLTIKELAKFASTCKYCGAKLLRISQGGWVERLECPSCKTNVEIHNQDAMSGRLVDYTIVLIKDGIIEQIDVPFKD